MAGGLEAGERDRIVTIQQGVQGVDAVGTPIVTWTTLVEAMPASKYDPTGRERFANAQTSAAYDTTWEMNYRTDMDPELIDVPTTRRFLYQGRVHDIVVARHIGRREGIELLTLASTKAGA
jgi:head-tail adaptor